MIRSFSMTLGLALLALPWTRLAAEALRDENIRLDNVENAFAAVPRHVRVQEFRLGTARIPPGGHFQGIQSLIDADAHSEICFVTRDSSTVAMFMTVEFPPGRSTGVVQHLQLLPSDGQQPPLRHAGGAQLIGDYLVIGIEDNQARLRSQVQFWDVSDPRSPRQRQKLTVYRQSSTPEAKTAGAVGIVKRGTDHVLVVANWDCLTLDFYRSNGLPLCDDRCRFEWSVGWTAERASRKSWVPDRHWGDYQGITLVADRTAQLFLLACYTDRVRSNNIVDLFKIDLLAQPDRMLQKVATKRMALQGGAQFRSAGGFCVKSPTKLVNYSIEHNVRESDVGERVTVNISP